MEIFKTIKTVKNTLFKKRLGVDVWSEGGTPDPIPNSEVKPFSADDTWK
jgi:hypothetical protein